MIMEQKHVIIEQKHVIMEQKHVIMDQKKMILEKKKMIIEKKKMLIEKKYSIKHFNHEQDLKKQRAMCHAELVSASAFCFFVFFVKVSKADSKT